MRLSVALAYYNGGKYIEEQLYSIFPQLGEQDEVVISSDGTEDGSGSLLEELAQKESRLRILQGPGKGVVKNFEYAITQCRGDVIFLADQDDIWKEGKVGRVLQVMKKQKASAVIHNGCIIDGNGNLMDVPTLFELRSTGAGIMKNLIKNSYIGCCMAFRRELLPIILPIPEYMYMHDYWIGTAAEYKRGVALIEEPLLLYRRHGDNVTQMHRGSVPFMLKKRAGMLRGCLLLKKRIKASREKEKTGRRNEGEAQ